MWNSLYFLGLFNMFSTTLAIEITWNPYKISWNPCKITIKSHFLPTPGPAPAASKELELPIPRPGCVRDPETAFRPWLQRLGTEMGKTMGKSHEKPMDGDFIDFGVRIIFFWVWGDFGGSFCDVDVVFGWILMMFEFFQFLVGCLKESCGCTLICLSHSYGYILGWCYKMLWSSGI